MRNLIARLLCIWLAAFSATVFAAATVSAVGGTVQLTPKNGKPGALAEGQRVESGAAIKTGSDSSVTLRFDDGQMVALTSNTSFVIDDYRFNPHKPAEGGFLSTLVRGGMRSVTGIIGKANPSEVKVKVDTATAGIRGTDFQLFYDGTRLFISVRDGAVSMTNAGGVSLFDAKTSPSGVVPDAQTRARPTPLNEFPAAALGAIRRMDVNATIGTKNPNPNDPGCSDRR
jgi:hypothetical protein